MSRIVTLDFETYYDKDYSLKKLTTESYIRDERFEVIGVTVKVDDYPTDWFSGTMAETKDWLSALSWDEYYLLCHNTAFDGAILKWHFDIKPKFYLDTLSMSRPITGQSVGGSLAALAKQYNIGQKGTEVINALGKRRSDFTELELLQYGDYCKNDTELTYKLFNILKAEIPRKELYIIDLMIRMFTDPVLELSTETLEKHLAAVQKKKDLLMERIDQSIGRDALMSNPKFAEVLKKLGVEPPTKTSLRTGKEAYAFGKTDSAFKALLDHDDERVQAVVSARLGIKSTLEETRTASFIGISKRGALPIMLNYYGAHTGRASGGDKINLQNLPRGGELRKSIKAPKGHLLVASDSAQIEARVVAWLAGEKDLVQDFKQNVDIYSKFATEVYGYQVQKASHPTERFVGKTCIAEGTLVLSNKGWKPIEHISTDDLLWDGEEWVCHSGLANNGIKPTLNLCGSWLTPDHLVWSGTQWLEAQSVVADENTLSRALGIAAENLPSQATYAVHEGVYLPSLSSATATASSTRSINRTSKILKVLGAIFVPRERQVLSDTGFTQMHYKTTSIAQGYSIGYRLPSLVATPKAIGPTLTMGLEGSLWQKNGEQIGLHFFDMFKRLRGGIGRILRWTGLTSMVTTSQGIFGSSPEVTTSETNGRLLISKTVYDILNCGSRNRFTILTESGPLIVHNCILGLGYGMGAEKFKGTLKIGMAGMSVDIPLSEAQRVVKLYRGMYPFIEKLWKQGQEALEAMIAGHEYDLGVAIKLKCKDNKIYLPNGMYVSYPNLRKSGNEFLYDSRYGPNKIYGGKVIENVVQALARIVVFDQMAKIDQKFRKLDTPARRHKVCLTVHDEIVAVVPKDYVEEAVHFMGKMMLQTPSWCPDLPVSFEADSGESYGDCK